MVRRRMPLPFRAALCALALAGLACSGKGGPVAGDPTVGGTESRAAALLKS